MFCKILSCAFFTHVTWEAGEEPWERREPVMVQPLLSVLRRGRWQKVLHVKKKKSPWNEYSSTASTVSKLWPKRNKRATALTLSHCSVLRYLHQSSRAWAAPPAGLESTCYKNMHMRKREQHWGDWLNSLFFLFWDTPVDSVTDLPMKECLFL